MAVASRTIGNVDRRVTATFTRPASATAYAVADHIANSGTGSAVTPMEFAMPRRFGRINSCACVVTPESGNLVITDLTFDLLLFRPTTSIPFAAGSFPADNAAITITAASMRELVTVFSFAADSWRSGAGSTSVAGATGRQFIAPFVAPVYNLDELDIKLIGVLQVQAAWNPGNFANQFDFTLNVDLV